MQEVRLNQKRCPRLMYRDAPVLEVVVTARPSWARVKSLVHEYQQLVGANRCRVSLVGPAVSKRYGDISNQIPKGVTLKSFQTLRESDDLGSIALSCIDGSEVLARHWSDDRPDCVLVIADRTETLGVAMSASLMQIPLIHLQGGEVSGSIDDKVRDVNSKLADFHLTTNEDTKSYLLSIGEDSSRIRVIGCPSIDIVQQVLVHNEEWTQDDVSGVGCEIGNDEDYGIIMFHPDTLSVRESGLWVDALIEMVQKTPIKWFWFWPNPDYGTNTISKKIRHARELHKLESVRFVINIPPEAFINLACHSKVLVGNSSFGIRESSFIGLPVINIGHRQMGRQRANNVIDIPSPNVEELISLMAGKHIQRYKSSNIYGSGDAGQKGALAIANWKPSIKE